MIAIQARYVAAAFAAAILLFPSALAAQAFTSPQGVGSFTFAWQYVDNTGHRLTDGKFRPGGQSITASALAEFDYGVTDRFSATLAIPYVFAKYTGANPPFSGLALDSCHCWHSALQDISIGARYRLGGDRWAVTPSVMYERPSHDYPYAGEAVVGRNLQEFQAGVATALKLDEWVPRASVDAGYTYAFVERPLADVRIDRSNAYMGLGYAPTRGLFFHGGARWQRTNGGLRIGSPTGVPFFPPGEISTPERYAQRDRLLRTNYWHLDGVVSYAVGPTDLFLSITKYLSGTDTHNGAAYTFGSTWYFDLTR